MNRWPDNKDICYTFCSERSHVWTYLSWQGWLSDWFGLLNSTLQMWIANDDPNKRILRTLLIWSTKSSYCLPLTAELPSYCLGTSSCLKEWMIVSWLFFLSVAWIQAQKQAIIISSSLYTYIHVTSLLYPWLSCQWGCSSLAALEDTPFRKCPERYAWFGSCAWLPWWGFAQ